MFIHFSLIAVLICKDWTGGSKCSKGIKPTAFSPSTSSFDICPTEDEAFRQLRGMDPLSSPLWPETFGRVLDTRSKEENSSSLCTELHESDYEYRNSFTGLCILWWCICIIWYFTLIYTHPCTNILSSSCEAQTHTHKLSDTSQTNKVGQKPHNHAGSWGHLTVQQLSLQSKGNISSG